MGDYDGLHIAVELGRNTPKNVIEILQYMFGDRGCPPSTPAHPLFETRRWHFMLNGVSAYHAFDGAQSGVHTLLGGAWNLTVLSSFKNYDDEIEKFVDWISPYIDSGEPKWIGYHWVHDTAEPVPLYRKES